MPLAGPTHPVGWDAKFAIDGNKVGCNLPGVAITNSVANPYWRAEFVFPTTIYKVIVTTRMETYHLNRLSNYYVTVGNDPDVSKNKACNTVGQTGNQNVFCGVGGVTGKYLGIQIRGKSEYLELCEVEAFGPV